MHNSEFKFIVVLAFRRRQKFILVYIGNSNTYTMTSRYIKNDSPPITDSQFWGQDFLTTALCIHKYSKKEAARCNSLRSNKTKEKLLKIGSFESVLIFEYMLISLQLRLKVRRIIINWNLMRSNIINYRIEISR